jgi:hypothetical protein
LKKKSLLKFIIFSLGEAKVLTMFWKVSKGMNSSTSAKKMRLQYFSQPTGTWLPVIELEMFGTGRKL